MRLIPAVVFCISAVFAQEPSVHEDSLKSTPTWLKLAPIKQITFRTYNLKTQYPSLTYRLVNSDGELIERGWTPFIGFEGEAELFSRLSLKYDVRGSRGQSLSLRKGSIKISDFGVSLEVARGSVWMGHGSHGSLLLSNNGEPFTLVKFQTEKPFSIPYLGEFQYYLFNGWPDNFKILGQRLSYFPIDWIEIGGNQTVIYTQDYKFWEFFRIISAEESNVASFFNTDQRASIDLAVRLPFLSKILPPIVDAKVYAEYAGEDLFAWWQPEDKIWFGPLGFDFLDIGTMYGLWVKTEHQEVRLEYAQNYRNTNFFHSRDDFSSRFGYGDYTYKWYVGQSGPFLNGGAVMGHHMGNAADDLYLEVKQFWNDASMRLSYDRQRRGLVKPEDLPWHILRNAPEYLNQYGIELSYSVGSVSLNVMFLQNEYKNVSITGNPLNVIPIPRRNASESIFGLTMTLTID